ncbi:MAG TPA: spore coat protein [Xanthomonadaceae bacterium]|nr:spore coat protein [Xanthomonadaceae bacterium]
MTIRSSNNRRFAIPAVSLLAIAAATFNAGAAQQSTTFTVDATVAAACTVSATALDFGDTVNVLGGAVDGTGTLTATCTSGSAYTIGLNAGVSDDATVADRAMTLDGGTDVLRYSLSSVAAGGLNWEDVGGANLASGTGNGAAQAITVYGRIPAGQTDVTAGTYQDTITATIEF